MRPLLLVKSPVAWIVAEPLPRCDGVSDEDVLDDVGADASIGDQEHDRRDTRPPSRRSEVSAGRPKRYSASCRVMPFRSWEARSAAESPLGEPRLLLVLAPAKPPRWTSVVPIVSAAQEAVFRRAYSALAAARIGSPASAFLKPVKNRS